MGALTLKPVVELSGDVRLPGSKSVSNRVLLLASLARGETQLANVLQSDDVRYMVAALAQLGIDIEYEGTEYRVTGAGGPLVRDSRTATLNLGLAGTALRPLTAALTLGSGTFTVDGNARMRERPVAHLVDGLRQLGARIDYLGQEGYPPLKVTGTGLLGGTIHMPGNVSSQFLTSILMAAPLADGPVLVNVDGEQVSKPYLDLTIDLMRRFGAQVSHEDHQRFAVQPRPYASPGWLLVEGDASAATYFLAAGAIRGLGVTVHGIGATTTQGDVAFVDVLRAMGADVRVHADCIQVKPGPLRGVDLDLNHIPDAAMTVAILALFAAGTTCIRNIGNWRVKETDRLRAMACELTRVGATVSEGEDYLVITPPSTFRAATIETYGDHRMAMCFSLCALGGVAITIEDPDCVSKTFPEYFAEFERLAKR